jgi:NAD(P)H-dependent FMN reductase
VEVNDSFSILAISGSLRAYSSNTEALRAAALLAPPTVSMKIFDGLAALPHFNPDCDLEGSIAPAPVNEFRVQVGEADALLICSPEYAHGVPGSLKNALDWLVSAPEMVCKPIGLLNISPRSRHAHASLAETLRTMSTVVVGEASVEVPIAGTGLDAGGIVAVPDFAKTLRASIDSLVDAVEQKRALGEAAFCL